jgi:hypothetical protein
MNTPTLIAVSLAAAVAAWLAVPELRENATDMYRLVRYGDVMGVPITDEGDGRGWDSGRAGR